MDNFERLTKLLVPRESKVLSELTESAEIEWSDDFLRYVTSRLPYSTGVAQTILAEPVDQSYKAIAKNLDPFALSPTVIWWALKQALNDDRITLAKDSLSRDLIEHVRRGWKTGKHYARQTDRFWETWSQRFSEQFGFVSRVKTLFEEKVQPGWLPNSREDSLIVEVVTFAFTSDDQSQKEGGTIAWT